MCPFQHSTPTDTKSRCPYLGLENDPFTCFAYPSNGNFCHRVELPRIVRSSTQLSLCLTSSFETCPVYQAGGKEKESEVVEEPQEDTPPVTKQTSRGGCMVAFLVGLILLGVVYVLWGRNVVGGILKSKPTAGQTALATKLSTSLLASETGVSAVTPTSLPTASPSPTRTSTPQPTFTPTRTPTPAPPTITPTLTPGPEPGTPFGPEGGYLIHVVKPDESLALIANQYQTTKEVLVACNVMVAGRSLQPGDRLVVMPGRTDVSGLPRFQVVLLDQQTLIADLASQYKVSEEDIRYYNALGPGDSVPAGRWLILVVKG
jgi:hypothetical protein